MPLTFKIDENLPTEAAELLRAIGHGGASGRYDAIRETAYEYAFILDRLGVTSPSTRPATTSPAEPAPAPRH